MRETVPSVSNALMNLRPGATWRLYEEDYNRLEWTDEEQTMPTLEEVEAEIQRIKDFNNSTDYQRKRAAEYPSFADQFDLLYHGGYDAWKESIQKIKDKYPKPN